MFTGENTIKVKALCNFKRNDSIFVFEYPDSVKGDYYYRPIGGTVNFGEKAIDALHREINEELGTSIVNPKLEHVFENIFVCDGFKGHEIVFMYSASFTENRFYEKDEFTLTESNGEKIPVKWIPISKFIAKELRLVPENFLKHYLDNK